MAESASLRGCVSGGGSDPPPIKIDLLCQVIDNFGDAGICWRLARQLDAEIGARVTLWIDQTEILRPWLHQAPAVRVVDSARLRDERPEGDLLIAAIGAELPPLLRRHVGEHRLPWIRYEYLTAEPWVDGCHALPSIKPTDGAIEWYFTPGFTPASGGLLRERDLFTRQAAFGARAAAQWRLQHGLQGRPGSLRVCLFGYAGKPLAHLIEGFGRLAQPVDVFIARSLHQALGSPAGQDQMRVWPHDWLDQDDFDRLLWSSDVNLVRGEESWVRAQWAGHPMIWQPYQQADDAHHVKLQAFLDRLLENAAPDDADVVRRMMWSMSGRGDCAQILPSFVSRLPWLRPLYTRWRGHLAGQTSLMNRLSAFMRDQLQFRV